MSIENHRFQKKDLHQLLPLFFKGQQYSISFSNHNCVIFWQIGVQTLNYVIWHINVSESYLFSFFILFFKTQSPPPPPLSYSIVVYGSSVWRSLAWLLCGMLVAAFCGLVDLFFKSTRAWTIVSSFTTGTAEVSDFFHKNTHSSELSDLLKKWPLSCTYSSFVSYCGQKYIYLDRLPAFRTSDDFLRSNEIVRTKWPTY